MADSASSASDAVPRHKNYMNVGWEMGMICRIRTSTADRCRSFLRPKMQN